MNKHCLVFLFLLLNLSLFGQTLDYSKDSKINFNKVSTQQIEDLALVARVWGFLKYHHPTVCSGKPNWDFALFEILPKVLNTKNTLERDQILLAWINDLGDVPICKTCEEPKGKIKLKPDHDWMGDPKISAFLVEKLRFVYQNRHQGKSHFGKLTPLGGVDLGNEAPYKDLENPDTGFRLLALFRYWNIIHYFFPYRHLITERNWNDVLTDAIPEFVAAEGLSAYGFALSKLAANVHDSHAIIRSPNGLFHAPILMQFIENQLVIDGYANDSVAKNCPLKIGDVVLKIDSITVGQRIEQLKPYISGSNEPTVRRNMTYQILRGDAETAKLTIDRNGKQMEIDIKRSKTVQFTKYSGADSFKIKDYKIADDIGYISIGKIKKREVDAAFNAIKTTRGLVIDIRNYPSDFPIYAIGEHLTKKETPFCYIARGVAHNPGYFVFDENLLKVGSSGELYAGKIAILVNETTQSSAEFHAMAFQTAPRAKIFGSQTAGADGNVSFFSLPCGIQTMLTGIGIYYPDGRETQRIGIVPDIEVKPTLAGFRAGKDEVLEKAKAWIRSEKD